MRRERPLGRAVVGIFDGLAGEVRSEGTRDVLLPISRRFNAVNRENAIANCGLGRQEVCVRYFDDVTVYCQWRQHGVVNGSGCDLKGRHRRRLREFSGPSRRAIRMQCDQWEGQSLSAVPDVWIRKGSGSKAQGPRQSVCLVRRCSLFLKGIAGSRPRSRHHQFKSGLRGCELSASTQIPLVPTAPLTSSIRAGSTIPASRPNRRVIELDGCLHSDLDAHANSPHLKVFRSIADEILDRAVDVTKWRMRGEPYRTAVTVVPAAAKTADISARARGRKCSRMSGSN